MDERAILEMKVTINCPVCYSGNRFETNGSEELHCVDCGFLLSEISEIKDNQCIFCGSHHFYYASLFSIPFLPRDSVCYVCGAHYKKTQINTPELRFSKNSFEDAQQSSSARIFELRAQSWH